MRFWTLILKKNKKHPKFRCYSQNFGHWRQTSNENIQRITVWSEFLDVNTNDQMKTSKESPFQSGCWTLMPNIKRNIQRITVSVRMLDIKAEYHKKNPKNHRFSQDVGHLCRISNENIQSITGSIRVLDINTGTQMKTSKVAHSNFQYAYLYRKRFDFISYS